MSDGDTKWMIGRVKEEEKERKKRKRLRAEFLFLIISEFLQAAWVRDLSHLLLFALQCLLLLFYHINPVYLLKIVNDYCIGSNLIVNKLTHTKIHDR